MKKYILALLVGVSLLSMQAASAATLTLATVTSNTTVSTAGPAASVVGSSSGSSIPGLPFAISAWSLVVDEDTAVDFSFVGANVGGVIESTSGTPFSSSLANSTEDLLLSAGNYVFAVLSSPADAVFSVTVSVSDDNGGNNVPLPASVWLFGSALLGLFGASRRKTKAELAA